MFWVSFVIFQNMLSFQTGGDKKNGSGWGSVEPRLLVKFKTGKLTARYPKNPNAFVKIIVKMNLKLIAGVLKSIYIWNAPNTVNLDFFGKNHFWHKVLLCFHSFPNAQLPTFPVRNAGAPNSSTKRWRWPTAVAPSKRKTEGDLATMSF